MNANPDSTLHAGISSKPFSYHMNHWQKAVLHNKGKCLFCFNTSAHNTGHKTHGFPIMKKVGLKFEPRSANTSTGVASCVATKGITPAPPTPPASTTNSDLAGSATVPGAFSASTKLDTYNSGNKFNYAGECEGAMYMLAVKLTAMVSILAYPLPAPTCPLSLLRRQILWFLLWGASTIIHSHHPPASH